MGKSLYITDRKIDVKHMAFGIPWNSDAAGFNIHFPNTSINIEASDEIDWADKLGNLEEITTIFIGCSLNKNEYDVLNKMSNIEQIYISNAGELDNIDFICDKVNLRDLCISDSKIADLAPLVTLMKNQAPLRDADEIGFLKYKLENIAIVRAEIENLSCFCGFKGDLSELNLHGNRISDLRPLENLGIYYANFSSNQISDISDFMRTHGYTYLMNFKNNNIKTVDFIKERSFPRRFFIRGNPIIDYSIFANCRFVQSDVPRNKTKIHL